MMKLSPSQKKALFFIADSISRESIAPTLRELCAYMGYRSIGSAQDVINTLRNKGYLAQAERQAARNFVLTKEGQRAVGQPETVDSNDTLNVPILGAVPAGFPAEPLEDSDGTLRLARSLLPKPCPPLSDLFALKISGQSMVNAGIVDGDFVVVKKAKKAPQGSVVVARVDGEVTCKRLMNDVKRGWYLKPENPEFENIYADGFELEILGSVIALQRVFH